MTSPPLTQHATPAVLVLNHSHLGLWYVDSCVSLPSNSDKPSIAQVEVSTAKLLLYVGKHAENKCSTCSNSLI